MTVFKPYSFNGTSLQSTDYVADFPRSNANLQVETNPFYTKRAGAYPVFTGKDINPTVLNLEVLMQHDFMTLFESLNTLFDTKDETPRQFICTDEEDTSKQYYVYATAKRVLGGHDGPMATLSLALDDPIWQSVTQNSQTFSTTSATDSTSVVANGNDNSYPIFEITPSTQPTGVYSYNMYCQVLPQSSIPYPSRYLDITGSSDTTWDTAALIAGGKMQASSDPGGAGGDIRVLRDGVFVDFWLNGINTTDTHVIVVADMPAKQNMTLKTALASTDTITEIELDYTLANKRAIQECPPSGRLILDSSIGSTDTEEFTYTSKSISATHLIFNVNTRATRNTTAMSFAAGANVRFLPYDFNIIYGNLTAAAYVTDDSRKPIQALTSRNSSFTFTNFWDETGLRAGIWTQALKKVSNVNLSRSDFFTSTNDEGDTDPATAMGLAAYTFEAGGLWRADSVQIAWMGYFPDLVASLSASGEQYQTSAARPTPKMQALKDPAPPPAPIDLWTVSAQSATDYSTWTTWSKATTDATIPGNIKFLRWIEQGTITGSTDQNARVDITSLTVTLTNYPHVMLRSEVTTLHNMNFIIRNSTTGDFFRIIYPIPTGQTLYIDTDPDFPTVKYHGLIVNGAISLSSKRATWMKLSPGSNTIGYESQVGASDISIVIKWRDRQNFF